MGNASKARSSAAQASHKAVRIDLTSRVIAWDIISMGPISLERAGCPKSTSYHTTCATTWSSFMGSTTPSLILFFRDNVQDQGLYEAKEKATKRLLILLSASDLHQRHLHRATKGEHHRYNDRGKPTYYQHDAVYGSAAAARKDKFASIAPEGEHMKLPIYVVPE